MKYKACVFIGRFQPVHKAHLKIIQQALEISETVIIAVGTAKRSKTIKNPWSTSERIEMIKDALAEIYDVKPGWTDKPHETLSRIKFVEVRDHKYNNTKWATEIYSKAVQAGATQDKDTALIGAYKDSSSFYLNMFPQWNLEVLDLVKTHKGDVLSATDIRDELFQTRKALHNERYLNDITYNTLLSWCNTQDYDRLWAEYNHIQSYKEKWSGSPFPPVFVTVDNVVIKSGHVLLVKRGGHPGKGLWALPGGFLDYNEHINDSAIRELKEETRIKVDKPILRRSIVDTKVFDHPERSDRGRTVTHAFLIDLGEGPLPYVKGSDDAVGAHWIPLADLQALEHEMYEDHMDIITNLTSRF
jgi:bifunctional NMN adenylyltransferase/nudix hydrolase